MRHLSPPLALAVGVLLFYSACVFPEITYLTDDETMDATGGTMVVAAGGMGGVGGVGGVPATTTTGGGGVGGMPQNCELANLGLTGLCSGNQKCTVTDPAVGTVGCALAGPKATWETCVDDSDCQDGSWCDLEGTVCKPFCRNAGDCSSFNGECLRATQADGNDIPNNVKTCIAMCSPLTASPCSPQSVTCAFIGNNRFDCQQSANVTLGSSCATHADCAATLGCISSIGSNCEQFCAPVGQPHPNCLFSCLSFATPAVTYEGVVIGSCL